MTWLTGANYWMLRALLVLWQTPTPESGDEIAAEAQEVLSMMLGFLDAMGTLQYIKIAIYIVLLIVTVKTVLALVTGR